MGIIGSLIIHSIFLFFSSYIHLGKIQKEMSIIEVSLIPIPEEPKKEKVFIPKKQRVFIPKKERIFIPKKVGVKGPIIPSVRDEAPLLRWKPKMVIPKELEVENGGKRESQGQKLDIANTYGEVKVGGEGKGKEGVGEGEEGKGGYTLEIGGEVAKRAIFYQEGFKLPEWFEKKGISTEGMFKFWVLPDGSVDRVSIEHSFGYRELDSLAMNAILRWRFCSLKGGTYEEWGIARIKIKLK